MPETYKVHLTRLAQNDLAGIYDYISADNPGNAKAFVQAIEEKILSLQTMPARVPLIPENAVLGTAYRHLLQGKYRVIFRIHNDTVIVLRIIHGAQLLNL